MGENDDSDIIEHHVEEEMEKKTARIHAVSSPLLESLSPSEREGHSSTQSSHRLLAYSDALISIIATVMLCPSFLIYSFTFHRLFQVIVRIDDCLALLNLSVIVLYAFSRPFLLNDQIQISENQTFYKHHILKVIMRVPIMCFFASIFSFIFFQLSLKWCRSKAIGQVEETPDSMLFYTYLPNEPLSKERVESFSDGVYAIVATLLILDICEDNVPDPSVVQKQFGGSLVAALQVYGPEYLAYFGSFATVGLLWFVHHSLFLHVTKATRFMSLLNTFSLAFVGGLPLAYQLTHEFPRNSQNELEAIQISCVIVFFAGMFQLSIWVVALYNEQETLHPYVWYGGREHVFMLAKLALYPCVALGTFFLTCILSKFSASIFHLMEITVPFAFLVLRLLVRIGLALLRFIFCPNRSDLTTVVDDETRVPFNAVVT
ncbi:hypothetical protein XENOCAPTIV_010418 [Xenoophorus captivus]|uniref:Endosomal/lysosomal proton channel TMEM175 n=1 Tax=Xenoophorus captivus TaxID=1517983 RepID=A0ABV0RKP5_9TELE